MSTPPHPIWRKSYRWCSPFFLKLAKILAFWDEKFEKTLQLRSAETWDHLPTNQFVFHCASVGEFEAARPIIEELVRANNTPIVAMGSPSLESRRSAFANAGFFWCWSPLDIPSQVETFLKKVQPKAIVITKHDIWPELVWRSRELQIPVLLQSANFRPDSKRNVALIRSFQRSLLGALQGIGAISDEDANRFRDLLHQRTEIKVTGDTRYDRVLQIASQVDKRPIKVVQWIRSKPTIILGSSWEMDEELLFEALQSITTDYHLIVVPHETYAESIRATLNRLSKYNYLVKKYTEGMEDIDHYQVLLIDVQGILATMYRDTKIAWVGGGFGQGVHSVLEPAAFGVPVFFGPNHLMSREARLLIQWGAGFVVSDQTNWKETLIRLFNDEQAYQTASNQCLQFVQQSAGATNKVLEWIQSL
ncbi:MAG: hypothetical protein N2450_07990 [bacterium]|nr:hypothetical protein [bacterium]